MNVLLDTICGWQRDNHRKTVDRTEEVRQERLTDQNSRSNEPEGFVLEQKEKEQAYFPKLPTAHWWACPPCTTHSVAPPLTKTENNMCISTLLLGVPFLWTDAEWACLTHTVCMWNVYT